MRIEITLRTGSRIILNATVLEVNPEEIRIKSFIERNRTYSWAEVSRFEVVEPERLDNTQENGR